MTSIPSYQTFAPIPPELAEEARDEDLGVQTSRPLPRLIALNRVSDRAAFSGKTRVREQVFTLAGIEAPVSVDAWLWIVAAINGQTLAISAQNFSNAEALLAGFHELAERAAEALELHLVGVGSRRRRTAWGSIDGSPILTAGLTWSDPDERWVRAIMRALPKADTSLAARVRDAEKSAAKERP